MINENIRSDVIIFSGYFYKIGSFLNLNYGINSMLSIENQPSDVAGICSKPH